MPRDVSFPSTFYPVALFLFISASICIAYGDPIPANNVQGSMHGFLVLKSSDGKIIAVGDMVQLAHGSQVHSRLVFHFRDGSIDEDTTVFTQGQSLKLVSDHHVQKGASFPKPLDLMIQVAESETRSLEVKDGKAEIETEHVDLPDDLANGMVPLVLEKIAPGMQDATVSYLVGTPKPRIVKLSIKPEGLESYGLGGLSRQAKKYKIHIEIGGITGVVAPIIGKEPPDLHIWVADGNVPTVVKIEGALYEGGPIWIMEQTVPVWPRKIR